MARFDPENVQRFRAGIFGGSTMAVEAGDYDRLLALYRAASPPEAAGRGDGPEKDEVCPCKVSQSGYVYRNHQPACLRLHAAAKAVVDYWEKGNYEPGIESRLAQAVVDYPAPPSGEQSQPDLSRFLELPQVKEFFADSDAVNEAETVAPGPQEGSEIDWNDDEAVVRSAHPNVWWEFDPHRGRHYMYTGGEPSDILARGISVSELWPMARKHSTVQAFEARSRAVPATEDTQKGE